MRLLMLDICCSTVFWLGVGWALLSWSILHTNRALCLSAILCASILTAIFSASANVFGPTSRNLNLISASGSASMKWSTDKASITPKETVGYAWRVSFQTACASSAVDSPFALTLDLSCDLKTSARFSDPYLSVSFCTRLL